MSNHRVFHSEDYFQMCYGVINDSIRGSIVLGTAILDQQIERLLRIKFAKDSGASDKEIDMVLSPMASHASLVGLAQRTRVAHLLGMIDESTSKGIRKLARLRNDFAHLQSPPEFTESLVQTIVNELSENYKLRHQELMNDSKLFPLHDRHQRAFLGVFIVLYDELESAVSRQGGDTSSSS